jgi:PTS system nitrogen regulatory IIA component
LLEREDLTTFGIGRGIALPHAIVPGLAKPLGIFGRLTPPIDFMAADGRLADLIFLLLVPGRHILLPALSCVARRLHDDDAAGRLRVEDSREQIHLILTAGF